ncbi:ABC transporter substrate-binding protein [Plantibacter sp. Mn2098]|uniref:ABC transporter substrate-binding protein n=1 Tax=Plantibacter sp. Mn2098 TaxID=3395266 RepID=UPI003BDAE7F6
MTRITRDTSSSRGPRRTARVFATVAATAALSLLLAACGSSGGASTAGGITAWGTTADKPLTEPSVTEFNAANSKTQIKANYFGTNDYKDKIRTAINSPQAPTLVYTWGGGTMAQYVKAGLLRDLTPDLKDDKAFTDRLIPSVAAGGINGGKTYAIPMDPTSPVVLYFNEDVLKKAGVEQPKTWDELLAAVPKIKDAGFAPIALGGGSKWPYLMWIEYLVDRIGGPQVFQNILDNKPDAWSDPAVIKANTMIQQLVKAGGFAEGFASVSADTNADLALMVTGKAAMLLQGAWAYSGISQIDPTFESSGKLGFGPFPAVEGGKGDPKNIAGNPASYWAVSAKATDAQAKTAMNYLTKTVWNDAYTKSVIDAGNIPPLTGIGPQLKGDFAKGLNDMIADAPNFQQSWDLALSPAASSAFWTQLDLLFNGSETPQQFSDNMNKTIGK